MTAYQTCLLSVIALLNIQMCVCNLQFPPNETGNNAEFNSTRSLTPYQQDETSSSHFATVTINALMTTTNTRWFQVNTQENYYLQTKFLTIPEQKKHSPNQIQTTFPTTLNDKCFSYGSCQFSASEPQWFCRCDNRCLEFNDCCLAFNGSKTDREIPYNFNCFAKGSEMSRYTKGILAVGNCPDTYDDMSVTEKCYQDDILTHGTFVAYNGDIIFKNKFCAFCNNVTAFITFEIQFYNIVLENEELKNFSSLSENEKIEFLFDHSQYKIIPPRGTEPRYCLLNTVDNSDSFCQLYINPVAGISNGLTYFFRNVFCVPQENRDSAICLAEYFDNIKDSNIYGLSIIFSFQHATQNMPTTDHEECEIWTEQIDSKCQLETYKNYDTSIDFYLISNKPLTEKDWSVMVLISAWNFNIQNLTSIQLLEALVEEHGFIAKVTLSVMITKTTFFHEAIGIEKKLKDAKVVLSIRDNATEFQMMISNTEFLTQDPKNTSLQFGKSQQISFQQTSLEELLTAYRIFIGNHSSKRLCSHVSVLVTQTQDAIYVDNLTCKMTPINAEASVSILAIMTYVCFSISVVALIVLIIVNRKFKLVSNIAMTNLENMSISLLFCNSLFMAGIGATHIDKLCYVIGVFLHYLWLNFFSFMAITVNSIVTTLMTMKSRNTSSKSNKRTRRHFRTIVGLIIPLIFVIPSVVVDLYGPLYFSPGYGKSVCFPSQYPANLIFFTGPVVLSVSVNLVSLICIMIQICKVRMEISSIIRKANPYSDAVIYLRISILSGIFWITGIISVLTDSEWLNYTFTLLCGLQGLFITVANLTTSRTRGGQKMSNYSSDTKAK